MKNELKPRFRCTFKVFHPNNRYDICVTWFWATSREAARKQARRFLKENYGNSFEILSMSY